MLSEGLDYLLTCTWHGCPNPGYHLGAYATGDDDHPVEVDYACGHKLAYSQVYFDALVARSVAEVEHTGPTRIRILQALSGGNIDFGRFCTALKPNCPMSGDRPVWAATFRKIELLAAGGLLIIRRKPDNTNDIDWMRLTDKGADLVRARADENRGLLALMGGAR